MNLVKKIICLGDSNTWGYDPRSWLGDRYPHPWPELLSRQFKVANLGENGACIPRDAAYTVKCIQKELPAELLIVMLGTNDVLIPGHDAVSAMDTFLKAIRQEWPELPLLLLTPPDVFGRSLEGYAALAEKHHCCWADCNQWDLSLAWDGIHLTEEAHEVMSRHLAAIIHEMLG